MAEKTRAELTTELTTLITSNGNQEVTAARVRTVVASLIESLANLQDDTTAAGLALLDDVSAAAQRTTLGLGTLATQSGTFSGTSSGTNTGDQTNIAGNAATVTTNANLTGPVTSTGNATAIANGAISNAMLANAAVANLSGTNTGDQTSVSGNAGTATALATARAIYGNNFDGTAALTQAISGTYGGTGVNNGSFTVTLAGNLVTTGAFNTTFAAAATATFTLPPASCSIGYLNIPQNSQSAAYTTVLADSGKHLLHPSADTTARTFTIDSNANVAYPIGTAITFVNQASAGVLTIAITADTLWLAGAGTTGSRTLAANGIATALKVTATEWIISGTGLT